MGNGGGVATRRTSTSQSPISILPVGSESLTVPSGRSRTTPLIRSTYSLRTSTSSLITHCTMPEWSRRSTNARCSPCSRLRPTQPQTLTVSPIWPKRRSPQRWVRIDVELIAVFSTRLSGGRSGRTEAMVCWSPPPGIGLATTVSVANSSSPTMSANAAPERLASFICAFMLRLSKPRSAASPAARSSPVIETASKPPATSTTKASSRRWRCDEHAFVVHASSVRSTPRAKPIPGVADHRARRRGRRSVRPPHGILRRSRGSRPGTRRSCVGSSRARAPVSGSIVERDSEPGQPGHNCLEMPRGPG